MKDILIDELNEYARRFCDLCEEQMVCGGKSTQLYKCFSENKLSSFGG